MDRQVEVIGLAFQLVLGLAHLAAHPDEEEGVVVRGGGDLEDASPGIRHAVDRQANLGRADGVRARGVNLRRQKM